MKREEIKLGQRILLVGSVEALSGVVVREPYVNDKTDSQGRPRWMCDIEYKLKGQTRRGSYGLNRVSPAGAQS